MKRLLLPLLFAFAMPAGAAEDTRQFVQMPAPAQTVLRAEMLDMLVALHEIIDLLGNGKAKEAGEVAENRIGNGAKTTRHVGMTPAEMPGRHMTEAMRKLAWGMHDAGSEFAAVAKAGDAGKALMALPKLTAQCVSCHAAYRTR
jgi:hypothetical protein